MSFHALLSISTTAKVLLPLNQSFPLIFLYQRRVYEIPISLIRPQDENRLAVIVNWPPEASRLHSQSDLKSTKTNHSIRYPRICPCQIRILFDPACRK